MIYAIHVQDNNNAFYIVKFQESSTELVVFVTQIWWLSGHVY